MNLQSFTQVCRQTLILGAAVVVGIPCLRSTLAEDTVDQFVSSTRQLTFEGRRAGEGYFSQDGRLLVFQSERLASNPFYQIYLMDLQTGDVDRVSRGTGKTTCGWIHPSNQRVLFASTNADPEAEQKQRDELEFRASGKERRYSWDYDTNYDLWAFDRSAETYSRLTTEPGYDAEASYSPDGQTIIFASNREAYASELTEARRVLLERDPSFFIDLYKCNADGSQVERLTDTPGYDGGPFFSPDGNRICWRRFSEDGATAEIMTALVDGSDVRQLTKLGAMSWAPYFHPSGEYLVFTTNVHGFANFELYLVRADGAGDPVRVTATDGFDGLPVFSPNGQQLSWTSNRTSNKTSQIFLADWDHDAARTALNLDAATGDASPNRTLARRAEYSPAEMAQHVEFLASERLEGRASGSPGNELATAYVASHFETIGLEPAGHLTPDGSGYFDPFAFTAGVSLGPDNTLTVNSPDGMTTLNASGGDDETPQLTPLAFSASGSFDSAAVVFGGYGIQAPADDANGLEEYDSFVHLDVTDKWVVVLRFLPEDISAERRQQLSRHASLRRKAMVARDLGARGLIVFSGPRSQVRNELIPLRFDGSLAGTSIGVLSVTNSLAAEILQKSVGELEALQAKLDSGDPVMGFGIDGTQVSATVNIEQRESHDRNVLGVLRAGEKPTAEFIVVGAHVDHLGVGAGGSSLARDNERDGIHFGADDNASGVAAMLEIAEAMAAAKADGLELKRDIVFGAWSAEELGLLGASRFLEDAAAAGIAFGADSVSAAHAHHHAAPEHRATAHHGDAEHGDAHHGEIKHGEIKHGDVKHGDLHHSAAISESDTSKKGHSPKAPQHAREHPTAGAASGPDAKTEETPHDPHSHALLAAHAGPGHGHHIPHSAIATQRLVACLNLDMVGRLRDSLVLQGVGSSEWWRPQIERRNVPVGLPLTLSNDSYIPTDASAFYARGVPILSAFTGSHEDYHTPRDTADKLNYDGAAKIARLMGLITRSLATTDTAPAYIQQAKPKEQERRANLRAYLGTVPDYAQGDLVGVKLSGVAKGGPAEQAGVRGGDVIVQLAGKKIENIYDYTFAIEALKIGEAVAITVRRDGNDIELSVTPGSRD